MFKEFAWRRVIPWIICNYGIERLGLYGVIDASNKYRWPRFKD